MDEFNPYPTLSQLDEKLHQIWSVDSQEDYWKLLPPDVISWSENAPNSISAGAPPHTPLGELPAFPGTHSWIYGAYFWLNTILSPTKNNVVFSLGQTDGHCYHSSLKYVPKTSSCMENCTKFGHFILRKIIENFCHQMSYFEAKMHQIRFRLGLRPRLHWGSLQRSPDPLAGIEGAHF